MQIVDDPGRPETGGALGDILAAIPGVRVGPGRPLAELTTLRIGGLPRMHVSCATADAIAAVVTELDARRVPTLVLGGGSNLVVAGGDLDFVVVEVGNTDVEFGTDSATDSAIDAATDSAIDAAEHFVRAGAGLWWDDLVAQTVESGYGGLECLSGIPGSVGATPVQNVGAYGVEISQILRRARVLDRPTGQVSWLAPTDLALEYRTSILKGTDRGVVLEVEFALRADGLSEPVRYAELARTLGVEAGDRVPAAAAREAVLGLRRGKGMVLDPGDNDTWSAGSFFTNPVVPESAIEPLRERVIAHVGDPAVADRMPTFEAQGGVKLSAGWLIEKAGFTKGFPGEGAAARLSTKHTLAITNRGSAKADDVIALAREVRDGVESAFGVRLHPEPVWVGCAI